MTLGRRLGGALICLLPLCAGACTENDEQLVEDVGVTRLFVIDTGLARQSLHDAGIQVSEWEITEARLEIVDTLVDLLVDPTVPCSFTDTTIVIPIAGGACSSGIVIESSEEALEATLALTVSRMQVRRAEPINLFDPFGPDYEPDYDGDQLPNDEDNCPLVNNEDQDPLACTVIDPFFGPLLDSDADTVADLFDNCVWEPNPDQADTEGLSAEGIPDGIGDACTEQVAEVVPFVLNLGPTTLLQPTGFPTFITVDFDSSELQNCWTSGTCEFDPATVEFCTHVSAVAALDGC